jgi:ATP-binding protein involved in chromosome partitioning
MLQQTRVPILGLIENMSHFTCEHCGTETAIFDRGGGTRTSQQEQVPFLGEIPLDPKIRHHSDTGAPVFAAEPQSPQAQAFRRVAEELVKQVKAAEAVPSH